MTQQFRIWTRLSLALTILTLALGLPAPQPVALAQTDSQNVAIYLPMILHDQPAAVRLIYSLDFVPYTNATTVYIVGEIVNDTPQNVRFIHIDATLYNASGDSIGTGTTIPMITILTPGLKSPFRLILSNPPAYHHYTIRLSWSQTQASPRLLTAKNLTTSWDNLDAFHVKGEATNPYSSACSSVKAVVTLYNAAGEVIGADYTYTNPKDINAGATASFNTDVSFWAGRPNRSLVNSYVLQVVDD